mgnify:CR=1 FL=1
MLEPEIEAVAHVWPTVQDEHQERLAHCTLCVTEKHCSLLDACGAFECAEQPLFAFLQSLAFSPCPLFQQDGPDRKAFAA